MFSRRHTFKHTRKSSVLVLVPFPVQPTAMSSSTHTLPPVRPRRPSAKDRYRATLQAIAAGRTGQGRPLPSSEAQQLARRVLVEMGADWTRRGVPPPGEVPETAT